MFGRDSKVGKPPNMPPRVFLSYARGLAKMREFDEFMGKLEETVRANIRPLPNAGGEIDPDEGVIFRDTECVQPGQEWPAHIADAINSCQIFVPVYAQDTFASDFCGQEWEAFMRRRERRAADSPSLVWPILWTKKQRWEKLCPDKAHDLSYMHRSFPKSYEKRGLLSLLQTNDPDGDEFLTAFAEALVDAIQSAEQTDSLAPPGDRDPWRLAPFGRPNLAEEEPTAGNADDVLFAIAAATLSELEGRYVDGQARTPDFYRDSPNGWRPFSKLEEAGGIGPFIQTEVAKRLRRCSRPVVIRDPDEFVDQLKGARKAKTLVVLCVDPWSVEFGLYSKHLNALDGHTLWNCGVLIVWNPREDHQTKASYNRLVKLVEKVFDNKIRVGHPRSFRPRIHNHQHFVNCLEDTLIFLEAQRLGNMPHARASGPHVALPRSPTRPLRTQSHGAR